MRRCHSSHTLIIKCLRLICHHSLYHLQRNMPIIRDTIKYAHPRVVWRLDYLRIALALENNTDFKYADTRMNTALGGHSKSNDSLGPPMTIVHVSDLSPLFIVKRLGLQCIENMPACGYPIYAAV